MAIGDEGEKYTGNRGCVCERERDKESASEKGEEIKTDEEWEEKNIEERKEERN